MNNILLAEDSIETATSLREHGKSIVLTGGCFDIIHPGHLHLLENARKAGDVLFVLLESDEKIKQTKGAHKPIFSQEERAYVLSTISFVDYIVLLPFLDTNDQYDNLITALSPTIIATTRNDPRITDKKRQATVINAAVVEVTDYLPQYATSKIVSLLQKEL